MVWCEVARELVRKKQEGNSKNDCWCVSCVQVHWVGGSGTNKVRSIGFRQRKIEETVGVFTKVNTTKVKGVKLVT